MLNDELLTKYFKDIVNNTEGFCNKCSNNMAGVYAIYNNIRKMMYIGQTTNFIKRWKQHCRESCNLNLRVDFRLLPFDSFTFEVLEFTYKRGRLELETCYIHRYKNMGYSLYNINLQEAILINRVGVTVPQGDAVPENMMTVTDIFRPS